MGKTKESIRSHAVDLHSLPHLEEVFTKLHCADSFFCHLMKYCQV